MKHVRVISRTPAVGDTTDTSTASVVISFLIAFLQALEPLIESLSGKSSS